MIIKIEKDGDRKDDYDFKECMKYAPFEIKDVSEILACVPGEADGPSWHYIVKLSSGDYGYVTGSCDYTGWGCQESGDGKQEKTLKKVLIHAPEEDGYSEKRLVRKILENQIKGKEPYGSYTITQ